jgi:DNA-binding PadR family transcriptional regulator
MNDDRTRGKVTSNCEFLDQAKLLVDRYIVRRYISGMDIDSILKFLPLTPATFHILLSLADEERHGYAIMQDVATATDGVIRLGPGTLYGAIKKLLSDGLIAESDERPDPSMDDTRRRYYRITPFGSRVASAEASRLAAVVKLARRKRLFATA